MLAKKALAGTAGAPKVYVEDVFSTFLYRGTGSAQTITNNIDLSTEGGLVWLKSRTEGAAAYDGHHYLFDTARGATKSLRSNGTNSEETNSQTLTAFTTSGFSIGTTANINNNTHNFASWTFRKAKKFFDVVTYTGNGSNRTISHNLGSTPGCIIVKRTDATAGWPVYHRSIGATQALELQITNAAFSSSSYWNNTEPTSTVFTVGTDSYVNANGGTYVAYLFAHDAGGFGDAGSDSIISCGSFSGSVSVNLGWEAQWVLIKDAGAAGQWYLFDNMRGMAETDGRSLSPNTSGAESNVGAFIVPTATGFKNVGGGNYIYIAIRRGPMKTPTSGTSVYEDITRTGTGATATVTGVGFPTDLVISGCRTPSGYGVEAFDRLRGRHNRLFTHGINAEASRTDSLTGFDVQDGFSVGTDVTDGSINQNGNTYVYWNFRRAPGFFDVVCYTGTGSNLTVNHNLGVAPELIIIKTRSNSSQWTVNYSFTASGCGEANLNLNSAGVTSTYAAGTAVNAQPTSTQFQANFPLSSYTYVAYLFASVSGVSKVGSYTGNGSNQTINCGFTNGARFILIKRTDNTGDWYVWDSARGIVAANDPYLLLNSTAAEVTTNDSVDPDNSGFIVNQNTTTNINVNAATYIYLAIA